MIQGIAAVGGESLDGFMCVAAALENALERFDGSARKRREANDGFVSVFPRC
jgi:hypothetical protein